MRMLGAMLVGLLCVGTVAVSTAADPATGGDTMAFTVVNVEYEGSKIWVPGT